MPVMASALSQADAQTAAEWFTALKPKPWIKVVETDTVPKTYVASNNMRLPRPGGGREPIGNRIIELPEDPARALSLDPHSGFIAYVPKGSIAKGETLVANGLGDSGVGCGTCHGPSMEGLVDTPRLAGMSPTYIVRQVIEIQTGTRAGPSAKVMKGFVANVKLNELIAISAYLGSLPQPQ
jgi:cytochrome c553